MGLPAALLFELGAMALPAMLEAFERRWGRSATDEPLPRFAIGDGCFFFREQARRPDAVGPVGLTVYRGTEAPAGELLEALDRLELVESLAASCLGDAQAARIAADSIRRVLYWSGLEPVERVVANPNDAQVVLRWAGGGWWRPGDAAFLCTADERITRRQTQALLEALLADLADRCGAERLEAVKREVSERQAARRVSSASSSPFRWWMVGAALAVLVGVVALRGVR